MEFSINFRRNQPFLHYMIKTSFMKIKEKNNNQ
jgi:hypothetical protein